MAWEENSCICLNMQLIAILSRIGVNYMTCQFGAAKTSQISSAIQKISVTLSCVTIAITACKLLLFNTLKSKQFSLITKLSDAYILSNSR